MTSLFKPQKGLKVLKTQSFNAVKQQILPIKSVPEMSGYVMFYAPWCPHCQSKVQEMMDMGKQYNQTGKMLYVYNADAPGSDKVTDYIDVEGFPTFYPVTKTGKISKRGPVDYTQIKQAMVKACPELRKKLNL